MLMKRLLLVFTLACSLITLLSSCHTSEKAVTSRSSRQPKFINNVYIDPHNRTGATANAIDRTKRAERPKQAPKSPQRQAPASAKTNAALVSTRQPDNGNIVFNKYAQILGVSPGELRNTTLYKFIDRWYGANYRMGGCDKSGIDCSGFAQKLYNEVYGIDLLRTATEQFVNCKRLKPHDAAEGDLVFFHIQGRRISHVGIYLINNFFVHASTTGGVMISSLTEDYWQKYYAGIGRVPKG
jgi:cell wall-associated NlpC family hydrolase